jgi:hypothetical protein
MKYVIQVSDCDGNACRIKLNLPLVKSKANITNSTWSVLDEGWLTHRSGGCSVYRNVDASGDTTISFDLNLRVGTSYMLSLSEFIDSWSVANDSGEGKLHYPYALGFKYGFGGRITWALLS